MKWYRHSVNIKIGLFILGMVLVGSLLGYSQWIVKRLRDDNREIVKLYAEIIAKTVNEQSDANLNFIFDEIIKKIRFPIIYSDINKIPMYSRNLPEGLSVHALKREQNAMDRQNTPISLEYVVEIGEVFPLGYLHYGDSSLIRRLQWLPYMEIGAVAIFIFLGFAGFTMIRNSEKRHIWVGMARETAHQLGTPVSALMGWIERLKSHPEKQLEIMREMEADLQRLSQVSDRFSKMGSESAFIEVELKSVVEGVTQYLSPRLPSLGKDIRLEVDGDAAVVTKGNPTLISWALENVIRNGIDANDKENGLISILVGRDKKGAILLVEDNGKGIAKKDWKNIFRPGFSTKNRGWGLGLSLVKRIVEDIHGGRIEVVESIVGVKTVFEIRFK